MASVALDVTQVLEHLVIYRYLGSVDSSSWRASPTIMHAFLGGLGLKLICGGGGAVRLSLFFVFGGLILGLPVHVLLVFFGR